MKKRESSPAANAAGLFLVPQQGQLQCSFDMGLTMNKTAVVLLTFVLVLLAACGAEQRDFSEASIADLHDQLQRGDITSEELLTEGKIKAFNYLS